MTRPLPTAEEVLANAFSHLNAARYQASEAQSWLTAIDSPMTDRQRAAAAVLRTCAIQVKEIIDRTKSSYDAESEAR